MAQTSHLQHTGGNVISIKASLTATVAKEKPGVYVSYCPALDLYSQGDTWKEAEENIIEATELFIEFCLKRNTLNEVLTTCGFRSVDEAAKRRKSARAAAADGARSNIRQIRIPAEIPVMVA